MSKSNHFTIKAQILRRLMAGLSITTLDAFKDFQTIRLAAYINQLRKEGHEIETILVGAKRYALYYMPLTYIQSVNGKKA